MINIATANWKLLFGKELLQIYTFVLAKPIYIYIYASLIQHGVYVTIRIENHDVTDEETVVCSFYTPSRATLSIT